MAYENKCPFCSTVLEPSDARCPKCGAENMFYGVDMSGDEYRPRREIRPTPSAAPEQPTAAPAEGPAAPADRGGPTASTGQCPYCGSTLRSDEKVCPNCGAANEHYVQDTPRTIQKPRTIQELKEYCAERGMPLLRMRFFIGEDYREPRAFGIYRDGEDVIVYKNKADGSRAVRYRGPDEERGVSELFQKLLDECHNRGIYPDGAPPVRSGGSTKKDKKDAKKGCLSAFKAFALWFLVLIVFGGISSCVSSCRHSKDGYYSNGNGTVYYHYGDDWYYTYDDNSAGYWYSSYGGFPESDYEQYAMGDSWSSDWGVSNFKSSSTWDSIVESESSNSSDYSSDYDSWDSGGTDWDSDW
ncbi:MAG: hypothetical protein IK095_09045 [Oscillospiraceae bacterium]|nr:hypothetical protein [Oscillospiraceae bacterium]